MISFHEICKFQYANYPQLFILDGDLPVTRAKEFDQRVVEAVFKGYTDWGVKRPLLRPAGREENLQRLPPQLSYCENALKVEVLVHHRKEGFTVFGQESFELGEGHVFGKNGDVVLLSVDVGYFQGL